MGHAALRRAPAAKPVHYERRRPEETTLYQVVQEHHETFLALVEAQIGASLPEFAKDEFEAFLECGILAHGFLPVRCSGCAHEKRVAFSCKRSGFCPSCGALSRARLLKRVFDIDIEHGPHWGGRLKIIAAIEDRAVIAKILTHLGLSERGCAAPPRGAGSVYSRRLDSYAKTGLG